MYFPDNMTFQYFFFDTYIGYFLQITIIMVIVDLIYIVFKRIILKERLDKKLILKSLFVCYITGVLCLTLFMGVISDVYSYLFYGNLINYNIIQLNWQFDFVPDFFIDFNSEHLGNILMFIPFGILYPMFSSESSWRKNVLLGVATSITIEFIQPIFGRNFDINDIILNSVGVILSTVIYYFFKEVCSKVRKQ